MSKIIRIDVNNHVETNLYLEARNTTLASEIKGATDGLGKPACNFKTGSNTSNQSNLTDKEINPNPEVTQLSGNSKEEGKTGSLDQLTSQTKKTSLFRATYANIRDLQDNLIYQKKARQLSNEEGNNGKFNNGEVLMSLRELLKPMYLHVLPLRSLQERIRAPLLIVMGRKNY